MPQVDQQEREDLARAYIIDRNDLDDIAEEFERSVDTVSKHIREFLDVENLRGIDRWDYEHLFPEAEPEPEPESSVEQAGAETPSRPAGDRLSPPRPEEFEPDIEASDPGMTPRDVFDNVIETFPDYGSNVDHPNVVEYLGEMADYYGTPRPADVHDWLSRFRGVSEETAADVEAQYDDALDHQLQRGKLSADDVRSLFVDESTQAPQTRGGSAARRRARSRTEARVGGGQSESRTERASRRRGSSRAKERVLQETTQVDLPPRVEARMEAADVDPQIRDLTREVYEMGRSESGSDRRNPQGQRRGTGPATADELNERVQMLEAAQQQMQEGNGAGTGGFTFVDFLDQLTQVEEQLDELRGTSQEPDQIQQLQSQIQGIYSRLEEGAPEEATDPSQDLMSIIAKAEGMSPDDKAELLSAVEGAASDPEVKKEEYRLKRHENWASSFSDLAEKLVGGGGDGEEDGAGGNFAFSLGSFFRGLRGERREVIDRRPVREREPRRRRREGEPRRRDERPPDERRDRVDERREVERAERHREAEPRQPERREEPREPERREPARAREPAPARAGAGSMESPNKLERRAEVEEERPEEPRPEDDVRDEPEQLEMEAEVEPETEVEDEPEPEVETWEATCEYCGKPFEKDTEQGAVMAVRAHQASCPEKEAADAVQEAGADE